MDHDGYFTKRVLAICYYVCLPLLHISLCYSTFPRGERRAKPTAATAADAGRRNTIDVISDENNEAILAKRERVLMCTMAILLGDFIVCWAPSTLYYFSSPHGLSTVLLTII